MTGTLSRRPLNAALPNQMKEVAPTNAPFPRAIATNAPGTAIETR